MSRRKLSKPAKATPVEAVEDAAAEESEQQQKEETKPKRPIGRLALRKRNWALIWVSIRSNSYSTHIPSDQQTTNPPPPLQHHISPLSPPPLYPSNHMASYVAARSAL